MHLTAKMA